MKIFIVLGLALFGFYWLVGHVAPFPLSHEYFGLYQHDIHRAMGVALLIAAGLVAWKWKK